MAAKTRITLAPDVFWRNGELLFLELSDQINDIAARRHRAIEVASTYEFEITPEGVNFFPKSTFPTVVILSDFECGCSCPDIKNRKMPCKHIFAAALIKGDKKAILEIPPATQICTKSATGENPRGELCERKATKRNRLQDIKVGKYFTLLDFLISDTALKKGIPNFLDVRSPTGETAISLMQLLCRNMLDPLCDEFNRISITRGYLGKELYQYIYNSADHPQGALAHGFAKNAGADIWVHKWDKSALELALYIQDSATYNFDFIRVYPNSPILCIGVDPFKNKRIIQEWLPSFRGSKIHRPNKLNKSASGYLGEMKLF